MILTHRIERYLDTKPGTPERKVALALLSAEAGKVYLAKRNEGSAGGFSFWDAEEMAMGYIRGFGLVYDAEDDTFKPRERD